MAGWTWALFDTIHGIASETAGVRQEVVMLRAEVAAMSRNDITRYELAHWIELLQASNPELALPPLPTMPE